MPDTDLTITLDLPDQTPAVAFAAINEFTYSYGEVHRSVQRVTALEPGARVEWLVTEANLPAVEPTDEWVDTRILFELEASDGGSKLRFTHVGLTPSCSCYDRCTGGWSALIEGNLRRRIETGAAQPDAFQTLA
jgi:hypothetical protein